MTIDGGGGGVKTDPYPRPAWRWSVDVAQGSERMWRIGRRVARGGQNEGKK